MVINATVIKLEKGFTNILIFLPGWHYLSRSTQDFTHVYARLPGHGRQSSVP